MRNIFDKFNYLKMITSLSIFWMLTIVILHLHDIRFYVIFNKDWFRPKSGVDAHSFML